MLVHTPFPVFIAVIPLYQFLSSQIVGTIQYMNSANIVLIQDNVTHTAIYDEFCFLFLSTFISRQYNKQSKGNATARQHALTACLNPAPTRTHNTSYCSTYTEPLQYRNMVITQMRHLCKMKVYLFLVDSTLDSSHNVRLLRQGKFFKWDSIWHRHIRTCNSFHRCI